MKKHLGTALKLIASLGVGIFIIWFTFSKLSQEDRDTMRSAFANANYWWLLAGTILNLSSNFFRTERWRMLLKPLGYAPGFVNTFFSVMVMYFANLLFPRLGEILRCGILNRYEKIPIHKSIGTMVTERAVDLISLFCVGGILIIFEKDRFYQSLSETRGILKNFGNSPIYSYILYGIIALVVLFIAYKSITDKSWITKIIYFLKGIFEGLKSILKTGNIPLFIFHTIAIWACYFGNTYLCFYAMKETAGLSLMAGLGATFFGALAYSAVQGGLGAYPVVIKYFLIAYGIAAPIGFAFGWLAWSFVTSLVVVSGVFSLIFLSIYNRNNEPQPVNPV